MLYLLIVLIIIFFLVVLSTGLLSSLLIGIPLWISEGMPENQQIIDHWFQQGVSAGVVVFFIGVIIFVIGINFKNS